MWILQSWGVQETGLLMMPENNEAKAEARQCDAENDAKAKELV